jgi:type IV pilus assembly protein PilM
VQRWVSEPPPDHVFEITEHALAEASPSNAQNTRLEKLTERSLMASPSAPNLLRPQMYRDLAAKFRRDPNRRGTAALVIPDYAVRMAVLDFEEFPEAEEQRLALLRFRLKKSVPFHIDEAQVAYTIQLQEPQRVEVLAVAIARPILDEYEGLFSDTYRVGLVTPSCLAAIPLYGSRDNGLTLAMKAAGSTLSVLLLDNGRIRLVRCLDLAAGEGGEGSLTGDTVLGLLQQTIAFAEDQLGDRVMRVVLCGFEDDTDFAPLIGQEFQIPCDAVRSQSGAVLPETAGLTGRVEQYVA